MVIVLPAIAAFGMDGALPAAGAVAPGTGVAFVAVQHSQADAVMIGQSLVAFQLLIDQEDSLQESVRVESNRNPPQSVGTGQRFAQPLFSEAGGGALGQRVEAGQERPEVERRGS